MVNAHGMSTDDNGQRHGGNAVKGCGVLTRRMACDRRDAILLHLAYNDGLGEELDDGVILRGWSRWMC